MSATKDRVVREQLFEFVVSNRGTMIAVYNGAQWCVIKVKSVANRIDEDWHFLLYSEVWRVHKGVGTGGSIEGGHVPF